MIKWLREHHWLHNWGKWVDCHPNAWYDQWRRCTICEKRVYW